MSENNGNSPPRKKGKRLVSFNKDWCMKYSWLKPGQDEHNAKCYVCNNKNFTISHGGENDIIRHLKSTTHVENTKAVASSSKISSFFSQKNTHDDDKAFAEALYCYHSTMHSHSYLSTGCASGLFKSMFPDSNIAKKYSCGRTKTAAIVTKVLGPFSRDIVLKRLSNDHYFSISTDASNKGHIKTFPIILRYFDASKGIQSSLLSFYSLEAEDSVTISNSLIDQLGKYDLSIKNVTAYGADNASVNFGKNKSVYTALKTHNKNIIPVGCNLHILHNAAKKACNCFKIDIESIVIRIYNEFSSSTKKTAQLKEFFEWADTEWQELLKHAPTRWLSLLPAMERILKNFEPLKSYFVSQDSIPPIVRLFFEEELGRAYLGFAVNVFNAFQPALVKLQSDEALIVEVSFV